MARRQQEAEAFQITRVPGGYLLTTRLWIDRPIEEVFELCSNPHNLPDITPAWLGLKVGSAGPIDMHSGTVINYRFRVMGVPGRWKSLISEWGPPYRFVDQQVSGPFGHWKHEHTFESVDGGTLTGDNIWYSVFGGPLIHELVARRNINRLFVHRYQAMRSIFERI